jgi:hypothetical protein
MPTLTVQVTQEDIDKGDRLNNWRCPLCRALWRATREKWVVEQTTCFPLSNRNAFIPLPAEAIKFISTFDQTGCGEPFEFQLEMP